MTWKEIIITTVSVASAIAGLVAWVIYYYSKQQEKIENLKASNTKSAMNRLNDDVKSFRSAIDSIQQSVKELNASLIQNRSDVNLLKERLDDTKKLLERYEKNHDDKIRNLIKSEVTQLTKELMLIRNKRT